MRLGLVRGRGNDTLRHLRALHMWMVSSVNAPQHLRRGRLGCLEHVNGKAAAALRHDSR